MVEPGVILKANGGICCLDEFDKMGNNEKTAIHEVMEQQTLSIAKAGVISTFVAKVSILAAANPIYGRYNVNVSPKENINLSEALLSRFDLTFLIIDNYDEITDMMLAQHVFRTHTNVKSKEFNPQFLKKYIAVAKMIEPIIPK